MSLCNMARLVEGVLWLGLGLLGLSYSALTKFGLGYSFFQVCQSFNT